MTAVAAPETARAHPDRTLLILAVGALAYALAQTMIVPALPAIQEQTGAGQETTTWLLTAFLLSSSVATPLMGRLGDMLGKERILLGSLVLFGLGSLICALGSTSIEWLIAGRLVQGLGGAVFPLSFGIIRDEFPPERIGPSIGLISTTFGIGGGGGLVLAGLLVDHLSVAWIFWVSLAMVLVSIWSTWRYVPESPVRVDARIDWLGGAVLSVGLAAILLAISQGNAWGFGSTRFLGLLAAGLVVLAVFREIEVRRPEPLVDMALMARREVWTPNLTAFAIGFAMFGSYILIPQLVQAPESTGYGFGLSVVAAGLVMVPSALVMLVAGPLAGRLGNDRGPKLPLAVGAVCAGIAYLWLAFGHGEIWEICVAGVFLGIGIGMAFAAMANVVVQAVAQTETGVATAINMLTRNVGGAVGAQLSAALLAGEALRSGLPAESGYTAAFLLSGLAAFVALAATSLIPRRAAQPA